MHKMCKYIDRISQICKKKYAVKICRNMQGCLVQVGNCIDLETVGLQFEPCRRRPCGVTCDSSRTVVIKLRRTVTSAGSALRPAVLYAKYAEVYILHILHLYALSTLLMKDIKLDAVGRQFDSDPTLPPDAFA